METQRKWVVGQFRAVPTQKRECGKGIMAKVEPTEDDAQKKNHQASADEALLNEFFSLIAVIAMRLTSGSSSTDNSNTPPRKGEKPC
jgi:hypothetical protein